jgi:hypothetical protein
MIVLDSRSGLTANNSAAELSKRRAMPAALFYPGEELRSIKRALSCAPDR